MKIASRAWQALSRGDSVIINMTSGMFAGDLKFDAEPMSNDPIQGLTRSSTFTSSIQPSWAASGPSFCVFARNVTNTDTSITIRRPCVSEVKLNQAYKYDMLLVPGLNWKGNARRKKKQSKNN